MDWHKKNSVVRQSVLFADRPGRMFRLIPEKYFVFSVSADLRILRPNLMCSTDLQAIRPQRLPSRMS